MAADGAGSTLHAPELGAGKKLRQKALRVCVLCVCSVVQCGPTLCDPKDYSLPGSSVHGVFQARTLEWVCHFLLQGIFLTQGSSPRLLHWQVDSLPLCHLVTLCIFYRSWKKKTKRGFIMKKKIRFRYMPLMYYFPPANGPPAVTFPHILSIGSKSKRGWTSASLRRCQPVDEIMVGSEGLTVLQDAGQPSPLQTRFQWSLPTPSCDNQRCLQTLPVSLGDKLSLR